MTFKEIMTLPADHISYEAEQQVKQLLAPLTKLGNIQYFCYGVNYPDTSGFSLHTCSKYYETWFQYEFPLRGFFLANGWHLYDKIIPKKELEIANEQNLGNFITYIEHQPDKTIILEFGANPENHDILNFYMNNQPLLKKFAAYFLENSKSLLAKANTQLITPSPAMVKKHTTINEEIPYANTELLPSIKPFLNDLCYPFNLLSRRESECFALFLKGYSFVDIGNRFYLSPKTINAYFARIKAKLGCTDKVELMRKAKEAGVIQYYMGLFDPLNS
jgi:DNA-binding CsgD family transcriptional regulator